MSARPPLVITRLLGFLVTPLAPRGERRQREGLGYVGFRPTSWPTRQIAENGGIDGGVVIDEILTRGKNFGYDARRDEYVDMLEAGIIDPAKVSRVALQNAASVAGLLLTTDVLCTEYKEDKHGEIDGAT